MVLKGNKGAVQFTFSTGMYLPKTYKWWRDNGLHLQPNKPDYMGFDVGYHSPTPRWEGQEPMREHCDWLDGKCYYDGSGLRAEEWMPVLLHQGGEKIWEMLEEEYKELFLTKEV